MPPEPPDFSDEEKAASAAVDAAKYRRNNLKVTDDPAVVNETYGKSLDRWFELFRKRHQKGE